MVLTLHLRSISLPRTKPLPVEFPFSVPVIRTLDRLAFTSEVTFFVGDNGSGKSTLLEAIACAAHLPTVGSDGVDSDPTLAAMRKLAGTLKFVWTKTPSRGFFMRSEDFFGFAKRMAQLRAELRDEMQSTIEEMSDRGDQARGLAASPFHRELAALEQSYGEGLDVQSHGESYFKLFNARFVPNGLYLLDEAEAPLSPSRQLALLAMIRQYVTRHGAQFIIATHSPILLAYPGAAILNFEDGTIQPAAYDDLEHVTLTRAFLNNPGAYLKHLFADED